MKVDMRKNMGEIFKLAKVPRIIEVPEMRFIMIDGKGDPNDPLFQRSVEALYGVSYTIKFTLKKEGIGPDFAMMPLEGLWWTDKGDKFSLGRREDWIWTLMMAQYDHVDEKHLSNAIEQVKKKDPETLASNCQLRSFKEGTCAQILHLGPYDTEPETVIHLDEFVDHMGYRRSGKHHEIYMSDPRRGKPENIKTLIRYQIEKK